RGHVARGAGRGGRRRDHRVRGERAPPARGALAPGAAAAAGRLRDARARARAPHARLRGAGPGGGPCPGLRTAHRGARGGGRGAGGRSAGAVLLAGGANVPGPGGRGGPGRSRLSRLYTVVRPRALISPYGKVPVYEVPIGRGDGRTNGQPTGVGRRSLGE